MKQYKVIKIVYANSFSEAVKQEPKGEIVVMELNESADGPSKIGFK